MLPKHLMALLPMYRDVFSKVSRNLYFDKIPIDVLMKNYVLSNCYYFFVIFNIFSNFFVIFWNKAIKISMVG